MLTVNIDTADGLVNGTTGILKYIYFKEDHMSASLRDILSF